MYYTNSIYFSFSKYICLPLSPTYHPRGYGYVPGLHASQFAAEATSPYGYGALDMLVQSDMCQNCKIHPGT